TEAPVSSKAEQVEKSPEKPKEEPKVQAAPEQALTPKEERSAKSDITETEKDQKPTEDSGSPDVEKQSKPESPKEEEVSSAEVDAGTADQEPGAPSEKLISAKADALKGLTVLGKIDLPKDRPKKKSKPVASSDEKGKDKK